MGIDEDDIDPAAFLEDVEMRVGTIVSVADFPEARKDVYKLILPAITSWNISTPRGVENLHVIIAGSMKVDFGEERLQSAAGLTDNYTKAELEGRQVLAVVNLGTVNIAGFESQCLITGVDDENGDVVHLQPEREVPDGTRLY
jgi:tRNA-binding protein